MDSLKALLEAVIKYQDVMDFGLNKPGVGELYLDMFEKLSKAEKETNEEFLENYTFNYSGDIQKDFNNLQVFINDMTKE